MLDPTSFQPEHLEDLRKSGLSDDTIMQAGIYSVRPADISKITATPGVISLLAFPYDANFTRYKVFPTDLKAKTKSGKLRYIQPTGSDVHLYIPPMVQAVLPDLTVPLGIAEGEKKALRACQEGIPCLGIGGLWNWRTDARLLPELKAIPLKGRKIILYPDTDVWFTRRRDLLEALYLFGHALEGEGATVNVCAIPAGAGRTKQGVDDYLCVHQRHELEALPHISLLHKRFEPARKKAQARENFGKPAARPIIIHAHEITEKPMKWLWYPYLPRNMLTMLDGDPGIGKSLMLVQVATNLSKGQPFLDQLGKPTLTADVDGPQTTLILSAEESLEYVMIPRLRRAGADLRHIKFFSGWLSRDGREHAFDLQHMPILIDAIKETNPVLVILDPLVAYLGDIDMHRSNQTRPLMAALKLVADKYECTIMGVRHPSKLDQGGPLMYRGQGNMDIIGAARSGLWVQKHPAHPETKSIMLHSKTNIGMLGRTVVFSRENGEFEWVGVSRLTENMFTGKGPDPYAFLEAFFWIEELMKPGHLYESAMIEKEAEKRDISHKVLVRTKKALGVIAKQRENGWYCMLPALKPPNTTRSTGESGDTEDTGSTGYSEPISITYDEHTQETLASPDSPINPEYPVDPVVIRAREDGITHNNRLWERPRIPHSCPACGSCDWDVTRKGEVICIPCSEKEAV